jgi:hypothetical protein
MPANYTKRMNIWKFLTPLDCTHLEEIMRILWDFFIFLNSNSNFEFGPVGNRSEPEPDRYDRFPRFLDWFPPVRLTLVWLEQCLAAPASGPRRDLTVVATSTPSQVRKRLGRCSRIKDISLYDPQAYGPHTFFTTGFPRFLSIHRARGLQASDLPSHSNYSNSNDD